MDIGGNFVSLSSLPTALLIPPLNLLPLGLAGAVLVSRSKSPAWRRRGFAVVWLALAGLFILSLPVSSLLLMASLESGLPRQTLDEYASAAGAPGPGAIVILSGNASHGDEGGIEQASGIGEITLDRMRAGALLHHRTGLPVLVTGGVLEDGAVPIATQMAASLRSEFATPVRWVEPDSIDTWENARFSAALLRESGIGGAYIVTNAWHMRRSLMAFAHFGITAVAAPIRFDPWPKLRLDDFVPSPTSLHNSYYAMHELLGCAYYYARTHLGMISSIMP